MRITECMQRWLDKHEEGRLLKRFGGIQKCPWCHRWVQSSGSTGFNDMEPFETAIECGHCGGESFWRWEVGFIFLAAGSPPERPEHTEGAIYMSEGAKLRAEIEKRP